jgi:predicted metal-dependent hydrolase
MIFLKPKPKILLPTTLHVSHEGRDYKVTLKRSTRATRLSLKTRPGNQEILLTAPPRARLSEIEDFAMRHAGWIAERVKRLPKPMTIEPNGEIPFKGEMIKLIPSLQRGVSLKGNELHIGGELTGFKRRVLQFLMSEARREVTEASDKYASLLGVAYKGIAMRDTKSRWGSCSSDGSINYSWRIIMAPPDVLDYLCAHEVSHRREMNHSPQFWAHVRSIFPQMESANKWLKKHGNALFAVA